MSGSSSTEHTLTRATILALLVGMLIALHRFAVPTAAGFDPTAMLALGFVILASYTFGAFVDVVRLPHITGYLLAGLLFGSSVAELIPEGLAPAPFDKGVLNREVVGQLSLLNQLAVALIAINAGGELKIEGLRRGLRAIVGVLSGQLAAIAVLITALVFCVSGAFPQIALPGLEQIPPAAAIALGLMVASISFATSPAATIAVIHQTGASGPMARTVLSAVVLKDVLVVMAFAVSSVFAQNLLGLSGSDQGLVEFLSIHIGGSLLAGVAIGLLMATYLRLVGRELLLFLVGVVYTTGYVASRMHLDPVLIFMAAGFTVSNFSKSGHALIDSVEKLGMPVYVVFFTLAGATLHLHDLAEVAPYAVALVLLRMFSLWVGVRVGARAGGADPATTQFGWMGFVSQAGVAISLSDIVGRNLGAPGASLQTLLIGGVALNEVIGPVLLKTGLSLAKEVASGHATSDETKPGPEPTSEDDTPDHNAPISLPPEPWPEHRERADSQDIWGAATRTTTPRINACLRELEGDLKAIVRDVSAGPLATFEEQTQDYFRDLRREFLRHHRRLTVDARAGKPRDELATSLRTEQAGLAERWRGIVLGRAARLTQNGWSPDKIVHWLDEVAEALPESIDASYEPESFVIKTNDSAWKQLARTWLRLRRALQTTFSRTPLTRRVPLRTLGRFHLSGVAPAKLEALAALLVQADRHVTARTRGILDDLVRAYDVLAADLSQREPDDAREDYDEADATVDVSARLREIRKQFETELNLGLAEIDRIAQDGSLRVARVLAEALGELSQDTRIAGTVDLRASSRRGSRIFKRRVRAIHTLTERLDTLRKSSAAGYSMLAMELELVGLEARIKDALEEHVSRFESEVDRRGRIQAIRTIDAIRESMVHVETAIGNSEEDESRTGEALGRSLREITDSTERTIGEAARVARGLRDELSSEEKLAPLLQALSRSAGSLTTRYEVVAGRVPRGEYRLPESVGTVEVNFREWVSTYAETDIAPKLFSATRTMATKLGPFVGALQELERLVAFNVELATAELEAVHDEGVPEATTALLREMILGQLERSGSMVEGYVERAAAWPREIGKDLRDAVLGALDTLRGQLVDGQIDLARLDSIRRKRVGQKLIQRAEKLPGIFDQAGLHGRRALETLAGEARIERWRRALGIPLPAREALAPELFAPPEPASDIPLVYRRLFAADTIEAGDVLTGRESSIERARRALSVNASGGCLRAVALIGIDGVGKAAVSSAVVRSAGFRNVRRIHLRKPLSLDEVRVMFTDTQPGQLIVFEGIHWLLSARPRGFDPLREFVDRVIQDQGRTRWLIHADLLFWRYASTIAPLEDAFPEQVHLRPLSVDELQAAVMARHRLSGYSHTFTRAHGPSRIEGIATRSAARFRQPYDQYFRDLHVATGGLVRDALRLWLASILDIEGEDLVHVGTVPASGYAAVSRLPEHVLLCLHQIARQGWMNADVHGRLFRIDEASAAAQLSRFQHMGLLTERQGHFRIARHLRGSVGRVIQERGWL